MKHLILSAALLTSSALSMTAYAVEDDTFISEQMALKHALKAVNVEVLGVRFDEPDSQWDVFIRTGEQAYEIEVDAVSGKVIETEEESLQEIQAELAGDLSHEGVEGDVDK